MKAAYPVTVTTSGSRPSAHLDPQVTHCGVFDAQRELLFAGLLDGDGGRKPTSPIIFDRGKISIEWH
jgi:hypothetical protein